MVGMVRQAVELALHNKPRPAKLAPGRLIQSFKEIQLLAAYASRSAVNSVTDGGYEEYEELLADVAGWTGTNNLTKE